MKIVKFEQLSKKEKKEKNEIIDYMKNSNQFLVIFLENNGDETWFADINMTKADIIVACETVKAKVFQRIIPHE